MKKLLLPILLLSVLIFAACEDKNKDLVKIVEVDTSPYPDSLKLFLKDEAKMAIFNEKFFLGADYHMAIASYGRNTIYTNSAESPLLPRNVVNIRFYKRTSSFSYQLESYYSIAVSDGTALNETTDDTPIENTQFYDSNQYVFRVISK